MVKENDSVFYIWQPRADNRGRREYNMYPGVEKLAKLIKIMARDVSKESSWWKQEHVGVPLGLLETDEFFHEISVTDDSGYRDITIGDTRGNVSNGRKIPKEAHRG